VEDTIAAGGSVTYATIHTAAGDPCNGSVVVSSDQPIAAIANTLGDFPAYAAATGGFSEGSTSFSLPLVMCNNSGFDTWFNIQNAGTGTASITINYIAGPLGGTDATDTATIEPGRALTFNQAEGSSGTEKKCAAGLSAAAGERFVGGATITSNEPIVATVMQINTGGAGFDVLMGYNGFTGGSADIRAPLIMQANAGFYTGLQVQNASDTVSTTVTIDYAADTSGTGTVLPDDTCDLDAGASCTVLQSGTDRYIGGATVTSSNGAPLVAIVNQVLPGTPAFGTAYQAFSASDATANINVPLIMGNNATYYTGVQVQNVSTTDGCQVTIAYGPNGVGTFAPQDEVFTLDAGASQTVIQNGAPPGNGSTVNDWTETTPGEKRYVGSALVTAGCSVVAIVNEFSPAFVGDQFYTYNAFGY
jgi:hypothetical protein